MPMYSTIRHCPECHEYVEVRLLRAWVDAKNMKIKHTYQCKPKKHKFTESEDIDESSIN